VRQHWHGKQNLCALTVRLADPDWMLDKDEPFLRRRDRLPEPAECAKSISAWELIKDFVGRDLAKVCARAIDQIC
jgi:hypothetical protein